MLATVVSIGMVGFLMAVTVVRYRTAWALGTAFEEPVWLICGFLLPVALLPAWVEPISWLLAPTWGVRAIRESALGGTPFPDLVLCLVVGLGYAAVGDVLRRADPHRRPPQREPGAVVSSSRIFFIGGLTSYRALFNWLSPWILVPTFVVGPITQILLFAYIGRAAGIGSDEFFVIGNALQYAAIPCLFAMGNTIADERRQHDPRHHPRDTGATGPAVPRPGAARHRQRLRGLAVRTGRRRAHLLHRRPARGVCCRSSASPPSAPSPAPGSGWWGPPSACGCGRPRCCPTSSSACCSSSAASTCRSTTSPAGWPRWPQYLPLTHGIAAARELADGAAVSAIVDDVALEVAVGAVYVGIGMLMLSYFEWESRRRATLEMA